MSDEKRNPNDGRRVLVTFGRSDPLHLTEATHDLLGEGPTYVWGPDFGRKCPPWGSTAVELCGLFSLYDIMDGYDVVYCGHGATLLEATAAGCEVKVLSRIRHYSGTNTICGVHFSPAWTGRHLDHSGRRVEWWKAGVMERMSHELVTRRLRGSR